MNRNVNLGHLLVLLGLISVSLTKPVQARDPDLASLDADHFSRTATVENNAAKGTITVSTEKGYVERHGLMRTAWDDEYLRAVLNTNTGQKSFSVVAWFTYSGARRNYETATFEQDGTARAVALGQHRTESVNCPTGECTYTEYVDFPVDERMLRALASPGAGSPRLWSFKIGGPQGKDYQGSLSGAEIAGLLTRLDEEGGGARAVDAHGQPVPEAPRDLGVAGISIDGTEDVPPRSGLLLTAVNRGSAGLRAGLLVGDMVYELDGHPIKTQSELVQALARSRAKATVPVKLYRGKEKLTLSAAF